MDAHLPRPSHSILVETFFVAQNGPGDWIAYLDYMDCKGELHGPPTPPSVNPILVRLFWVPKVGPMTGLHRWITWNWDLSGVGMGWIWGVLGWLGRGCGAGRAGGWMGGRGSEGQAGSLSTAHFEIRAAGLVVGLQRCIMQNN